MDDNEKGKLAELILIINVFYYDIRKCNELMHKFNNKYNIKH